MHIAFNTIFKQYTHVFLKTDDLRPIHIKTTTVTVNPQTAPPNAAPMIAPGDVALMEILSLLYLSIL